MAFLRLKDTRMRTWVLYVATAAFDLTQTSTAFLRVVEYAQFDVDQCNIPAINLVSHHGRV